MYAYRMETTVNKTGAVGLGTLPFLPADEVEVIILKRKIIDAIQPPVSFLVPTNAYLGMGSCP
ncbi:MAG: hypothetical protein KJO08_06565 [Gammaproteobacteria bacterium]|nr:hypothetical protein [Gammaproteobacteria bacterium]